MALLFIDGFDHMGTLAPGTVAKWGSSSGAAPQTSTVRTGTHALLMSNGLCETKPLPASGGVVAGVAFRVTSFATDSNPIEVREGSTIHLAFGFATGGLPVVKRGTTVLATGTTVLTVNVWYYAELTGVIHDTTGSYELRIDGLTELSASGVDTRNGGTTGQWDRIRLNCSASVFQTIVDDFYVCDTSGSTPRNTFLGPCKVETLYPQTDAVAAGSNAGLTPSTGTDHGALVDETTPNTSDYNSSATVGVKDTYHYASLTLTGTILGVQTNLYAAKSDTAARTVCAVVRAGGTDYDGANVSPTTTFGYFSEMRQVNPATSADWTTAEVNAIEAGMKVTA